MSIKKIWKSLTEKDHERTVKAKKNILIGVLFKGIGVIIGFAFVPLSAGYLGEFKYGIFIVLASALTWFEELDIGIGNGLRNRLGEAIADGDDEAARGYVSTAYFILGAIFTSASILVMILCLFFPWSWLLTEKVEGNITPDLNQDITILAILMFAAFALRFVSSLVYQIFYALQEVRKVEMFALAGKVMFLIFVLILIYTTDGNLILFGSGKMFAFASVPFIVGLYFFQKGFKKYRPSYRFVKKEYFKGLFTLGAKFFFIKSSMVVIYSTNAALISKFVSTSAVPQYDTAYKFIAVFILLFNIMTNQLWSANVEAYRKGDMDWMKKTMKSVNKIWLITVVLSGIMVLISPAVFKLWLQDTLKHPTMFLTFVIACSIATTTWVNSYNMLVNGTGKIKLQMYTWIITALLNIPLSIFFARTLELGIIGIVLGTIVSMLPMAIISPIQVSKLLAGTDRGIWAK